MFSNIVTTRKKIALKSSGSVGSFFKTGFYVSMALGILVAADPSYAEEEPTSPGGVPNGLNFGLGLGAQIPSDDTAYADIGADLYPELRCKYDISGIRFGVTAGYVYREEETYTYTSYSGSSHDKYELSFVPLKFNVDVRPIRFAKPDFVFQPYVGIGVGSYMATGDNDEDLSLVSGHLGIEFDFSDWYTLALDFAYNNVSEPDRNEFGSDDLSYSTVMIVNTFRIPFSK